MLLLLAQTTHHGILGSAYVRVFAKFLILGQFFKARLIRKIGLYVIIHSIHIMGIFGMIYMNPNSKSKFH